MWKLVVILLLLASVRGCPAFAEARNLVFKGASYSTYTIDLRKTPLRLIWRDGDTARFRNAAGIARWAREHGQKLLFATNAGMFEKDLSPCGLLVSDGRLIAPLNTRDGEGNFYMKPNGVFSVAGAVARVTDSTRFVFDPRISIATQSGPLLLSANTMHSRFIPGSDSLKIRSGVGVRSGSTIVFAISNQPVNFYDFASLFREELAAPDALFLDGHISKMYAPEIERFEDDGDFMAMFAVLTPAAGASPRR